MQLLNDEHANVVNVHFFYICITMTEISKFCQRNIRDFAFRIVFKLNEPRAPCTQILFFPNLIKKKAFIGVVNYISPVQNGKRPINFCAKFELFGYSIKYAQTYVSFVLNSNYILEAATTIQCSSFNQLALQAKAKSSQSTQI